MDNQDIRDGISTSEKLEIELNQQLNSIKLFKSADIMNDGKVLMVRINNSLKSDRYMDDYAECTRIIKKAVSQFFPTYKSWIEFDYGTPREFIMYIFVNTEKN